MNNCQTCSLCALDDALTIDVSDLHIKDDSRLIELMLLCDFLDCLQPAKLNLNGDIGDPWGNTWANILQTQSWQRLARSVALRNLAGLETVWVTRNHDYNAKESYLPGAVLCGEHQDGQFLYMHGWEFDITWGGVARIPGIAPLAFFLSRKMPCVMVPLYRLLFSRKFGERAPKPAKGDIRQDWNLHIETVHARARAYAKKTGLRVIIGHTHCPTPFDGLTADSGDWVDSYSFLALTDWDVRLITMGDLKACYLIGDGSCEDCKSTVNTELRLNSLTVF